MNRLVHVFYPPGSASFFETRRALWVLTGLFLCSALVSAITCHAGINFSSGDGYWHVNIEGGGVTVVWSEHTRERWTWAARRDGKPLRATFEVCWKKTWSAASLWPVLRLGASGSRVTLPLWAAPVMLVGLAGLAWWRKSGNFGQNQCPQCAYDLTGNVSGICPECGNPIGSTGKRNGVT
jgi:hypothetical protein